MYVYEAIPGVLKVHYGALSKKVINDAILLFNVLRAIIELYAVRMNIATCEWPMFLLFY